MILPFVNPLSRCRGLPCFVPASRPGHVNMFNFKQLNSYLKRLQAHGDGLTPARPPAPVYRRQAACAIRMVATSPCTGSPLNTQKPAGTDSEPEHEADDTALHHGKCMRKEDRDDSVPIQRGQVGSRLTLPLVDPLIGSLDPHHHASYENPTG